MYLVGHINNNNKLFVAQCLPLLSEMTGLWVNYLTKQ
jgi:hypothetical protein